jgi:CubicO group peptidase (beta-lactamase class C family)
MWPLVVVASTLLVGCTRVAEPGALAVTPESTSAPTAAPRATMPATRMSATTSPPPTTTTTTTTTATTTTTTTTTTIATTTTIGPTTTAAPAVLTGAPATRAAFARLAEGNAAASLTVRFDGAPVVQLAAGSTNSGSPLTTDTPMVVASVSKLVTALTVARLAQAGALDVDQPVPWASMGFAPHADWTTVTVRDLLAHTAGMPVARRSWFDDPGTCAVPLAPLLAAPPTSERGTWRYSNGNYCTLGLLVEAITGERYDAAAQRLVLGPAGATGAHLTVDGSRPDDAPYAKGVGRFDRLGAAGQWVISTDDVAAVLAAITADDREVLAYPGVLVDQYGWGHTGSVDGAVSCAWLLDDGRTIAVATVAGPRPGSGGGVCDAIVPAVAADAGLPYLGEPERLPR